MENGTIMRKCNDTDTDGLLTGYGEGIAKAISVVAGSESKGG